MGLVSLVLVVRALKRKASSAVVSQFRKLFTTGRNWWDNRKIGNLDDASKKTKPNAKTPNQNAENKQPDAEKKQPDAEKKQPDAEQKPSDSKTKETPTKTPNQNAKNPNQNAKNPKPHIIQYNIDGKEVRISFDDWQHFKELRRQLASGIPLDDDLITKMKPILAEAHLRDGTKIFNDKTKLSQLDDIMKHYRGKQISSLDDFLKYVLHTIR